MLKIGTRGSTLARTQAEWVRQRILGRLPDVSIELKIISTSADNDTRTSIRSGSATGVFVREIEEALLKSEIDLAVHSMKDMPTKIPDALDLGAIPAREDARDALISGEQIHRLDDLPRGAVVGTGSVRRQAQILARRPDLAIKDIRGNVETRLRKLAARGYDAIILACAGLNRLGMQERIGCILDWREMLPAPGQGALALEMRRDDRRVAAMIAGLHEPSTAACVLAERAFLRRMGGGCNIPIAVHARLVHGTCLIEGLVATPDGRTILRDDCQCALEAASKTAENLADKLLSMGGAEILQSLH